MVRHVGQDNRLVLFVGYVGYGLAVSLLGFKPDRFREIMTFPDSLGRDKSRRLDFFYRIVRSLIDKGYKSEDIKKWFLQKNAGLQGKRPLDFFGKKWKISDKGSQSVLAVARSVSRLKN